jgi:hypothetical protein
MSVLRTLHNEACTSTRPTTANSHVNNISGATCCSRGDNPARGYSGERDDLHRRYLLLDSASPSVCMLWSAKHMLTVGSHSGWTVSTTPHLSTRPRARNLSCLFHLGTE